MLGLKLEVVDWRRCRSRIGHQGSGRVGGQREWKEVEPAAHLHTDSKLVYQLTRNHLQFLVQDMKGEVYQNRPCLLIPVPSHSTENS